MIGELDAAGWPEDEDEIRKRQIEEMMRLDRPRYFRDEAVQQEYRDILDRQAQRTKAEATDNGGTLRRKPFDDALARFADEGLQFDVDEPDSKATRGPVSDGDTRKQENVRFADLSSSPQLSGIALPAAEDTPDRYSRESLDALVAKIAESASIVPSRVSRGGEEAFANFQQHKVPTGENDRDTESAQVRMAQTIQRGTGPSPDPASAPSEAAVNEADLQIKKRYETRFKGTPLEKHHDTIAVASKREGIRPAVAFGVIAQETGNGKEVKGNNIGGVMGGRHQKIKRQYSTMEEGIDAAVKTIANNYKAAGGDLEKMRDIHAPLGRVANDPKNRNKDWLPNVRWFIRYFEGNTTPKAGIPIPRSDPRRHIE
jgi:hypothetical protein